MRRLICYLFFSLQNAEGLSEEADLLFIFLVTEC